MEVPMAMGRPKATLELSSGQRQQLESIAGSRSLPAGLVNRARIVLMSAAGETNQQIARRLGLSQATVGKWRRRFWQQDVTGLHDELRPTPAFDRRREYRPTGAQDLGDEAPRRHALEPSAGRTPHSVVEIDGAPHLAGVRVAAAPPAAFQIVERSLFRGEGARHRGVVSESTRE